MSESQADAAYQRGDYATAIQLLQPLAEGGNASAQFTLGLMHKNGQGVPQDPVQAHFWFDLAAANGDAEAAKSRDLLAAIMTPSQIAEAQQLARAWMPKTMEQVEPAREAITPQTPEERRLFIQKCGETLAAILQKEHMDKIGRKLNWPTILKPAGQYRPPPIQTVPSFNQTAHASVRGAFVPLRTRPERCISFPVATITTLIGAET